MTRSQRWAAMALLGVLAVALVHWPAQAATWAAEVWPSLRRWPDLSAQYDLAESAAYTFLESAARQVPAETAVLLVTPGDDWRRTDYVIYHRALYWLAPRPVVWAAPFAPDGSWEGRWHRPTALDPAALTARAQELGIECLLAWNVPAAHLPGRVVWTEAAGVLRALAGPAACACEAEIGPAAPSAWVGVARAGLGVAVILALGAAGLPLLARLGLSLAGPEAVAVCWLVGAAGVSTALLWLSAVRVPLSTQVVGLSIVGVAAGAGSWVQARQRARHRARLVSVDSESPARPWRWLNGALRVVIAIQVAVVLTTAVGRPLTVWDSWVNWGLKARLIFLEQGGLHAVYADPTRLITHPDYPLLLPLLQAWLYAWVGAADDRWAGLPGALFYLALLAGVHGSLRRQGVGPTWALVVVAAVGGLPALAGLTGAGYPDAVVAGLAALAAVYLLEWARHGTAASLALAALAGGLLPWAKREGLVLALVMLAAAVVVAGWARPLGRRRRVLRVALAYLVPLLVLAGPWYFFTAVARVPNPDYGPVTAAAYLHHIERLAYVGWRGLQVLVEPRLGLIAPLAALVAGLSAEARGRQQAGAGGLIGLGVPLVYLAVAAQAYVFSSYAPFEQHVITSLERLVLHVAVLPLLWLALRTAPAEERA